MKKMNRVDELTIELNECKETATDVQTYRSESDIQIFPNPTKGLVYLNREAKMKVFSQQGVLLQEVFGDKVDLSAYPAQIYLLNIEGTLFKVVKN